MVIHVMANPQNFVTEANKLNIKYEYLVEAVECIGKQSVSRLFNGNSNRGKQESLSAATIDNWLLTFKFVIENPNHVDNDMYQVRRIQPTEQWNEYVKLIKKPIPVEIINNWKHLNRVKLGDEAERYGMTLGIRNSKAVLTLYDRMIEMITRRAKIWNKVETEIDNVQTEEDEQLSSDYRLMNIFTLKDLTKNRGIVIGKKKKNELIAVLEEYDKQPKKLHYQEDLQNYNDMTLKMLKNLSKTRGFNSYNRLNKKSLMELHSQYDIEQKNIEIEAHKQLENQQKLENVNKKDDKILIFNSELTQGRDLRVFGTYDNPLFVAKDIAEMLGYKDTKKAVRDNIDEYNTLIWQNISIKYPNIQLQAHTKLINKKGIQSLIIYSKKHNEKLNKFLEDEFDIKFDCLKRLTKETEYINIIIKTFNTEKMTTQYSIDNGKYFIDLYFNEYKIAIECDEFGHNDRDQIYEEKREQYIKDKIGCKFIRFNPDINDFNIFELINKIQLLINNDLKYQLDQARKKIFELSH
jgi:very-short-patch-repair endonuclease